MKSKKLLKLFGAIVLATVIALAFVPGCAKEAPAPAPAPAPEEPIVMKVEAFWGPEFFCIKEVIDPTLEKITKESNGRLEFDVYYASALVPQSEFEEALLRGIVDLIICWTPNKPGAYPRGSIGSLPFSVPMDPNNCAADRRIMQRLWDDFIYKDFDPRVMSLGSTAMCAYRPLTTEVRIDKLEALEGLKLRVPGYPASDIVEALGATPVKIKASEMAEALSRGLLDGAFHTYTSQVGWGGAKYMNYAVDFPVSTAGVNFLALREKVEGLPKDLRDILVNNLAEAATQVTVAYYRSDEAAQESQTHIEEIVLPQAERERWMQAVAGSSIWKDWLEKIVEERNEDPQEPLRILSEAWKDEGYNPPEIWAKYIK